MSDRALRPAPRGAIAGLAQAASARLLAGAPREFRLVAACCRPAGDARARAIAEAAEGVDWAQVSRLVDRHRVFGLARDGLAQASVAPPAETAERLSAQVLRMTRRNIATAAETARLCTLLRAEDIDALFLKGATLEAAVYRSPSLKHSRDIDILIAPADLARARALLERIGYRLVHPLPPLTQRQLDLIMATSCEWEFRHEAGGFMVELHWRLTLNAELCCGLGLSSPRRMVEVAGVSTPTLRREELIVYLCAHGAQHRWSRLKWLADLAALLAEDGADEEEIGRLAQAHGAGRCMGQALLLRERLLGVSPPPSVSARLRSGAAPALETIALATLLGAEDRPLERRGPLAMASLLLPLALLGEGRAFLACEFRRYLIAPADVAALPLPPGWTWLYTLLRLPLWIFRRIEARKKRAPKG
jgi:hypothetical protein